MEEKKPEHIGVINPYALAEIKLKRNIAWSGVSNIPKLLEETLGKPYEELFDPKFDSPLYVGLKIKKDTGEIQAAKPPEKLDVGYDEEIGARIELGDIPEEATVEKDVLSDLKPIIYQMTFWRDPGDFFEEGAEMTDPIQGAVGNCYLIAAMSSVAWARTYQIAHRTRNVDNAGNFQDMIEFFKSNKWQKIEVTERIPMTNFGMTFKYARSSEKGEIWPAVYEKAYAKWITNHTGDTPNILATAYGDPVRAASELTGLSRYYFWTKQLSANDIWSKIRGNCLSCKTFNPMVAWTYSSSSAAPDPINYNNANLVANHAYSILGWQYINGGMYVILRNPWGTKEATLNIHGGTWAAWDAPYYGGPGYWRSIHMATPDGIFALELSTFKKYFAGFGYVK